MKLQIIKQFEIGDCCFYTDPEYRKELREDLNVSSLFGQIIKVDSDGICTIKFIQNDGNTLIAKVQAEELEWFDVLYDIGPQAMGNKYGEDISDNFLARGLMFKAAMRSERLKNGRFKRGDIVFDLDRRAEEWVDDYIVLNRHKDTFGIIDKVEQDQNGVEFYVINYGEDMPLSRYFYEIGLIQRFPKKDDMWCSEYNFTRLDNMRMDMLEAGNLDEYVAGYLTELDRRNSEETKEQEK